MHLLGALNLEQFKQLLQYSKGFIQPEAARILLINQVTNIRKKDASSSLGSSTDIPEITAWSGRSITPWLVSNCGPDYVFPQGFYLGKGPFLTYSHPLFGW